MGDALPPDRVARIKSFKEHWDKGFAKMKSWVGAYVVSMCGALGDELDFMKKHKENYKRKAYKIWTYNMY